MALSTSAPIIAILVALVSLQAVQGYVHTNVGSLTDDCTTQYDTLLASIPEPTLDGELNCTDQIANATANTDGVYCPSQAVLVACFQVSIQPELHIQVAQHAPTEKVSFHLVVSMQYPTCMHCAAEPDGLDKPGWKL